MLFNYKDEFTVAGISSFATTQRRGSEENLMSAF
jgi:hypothetical protein